MLAAGAGILVLLAVAVVVLSQDHVARQWQVVACLATLLPWGAAVVWRRGLGDGRVALVLIMAVGTTARVIVLPTPPVFSGDIHRYVWDGTVTLAGIHPMRHAPLAPELEHLRDRSEGWTHINHPELATIYPPAAQALFAAGVLLGGAIGVKLLIALADLWLCLALASILRRRGRPVSDLVLYAWCPFPILEFAGIGHMDPLMWAPAFAALAILAGRSRHGGAPAPGSVTPGADLRRAAGAGALLGVAVLAKLFAIVAVPFLLRRRADWPAAAACVLVTALGLAAFSFPLDPPAPGHEAGGVTALVERSPARGFYATLWRYSDKWRWNESLFALADGVVITVTGADPAQTGPTHLERLAKLLLLVPVALFALWIFVRRRPLGSPGPAEVGTLAMIGAYLWTSPVVHPWYLAWALPGAALARSAGWFYLAAASWLTYLPDPTGGGNVPLTIRLIEYLPAAAILMGTVPAQVPRIAQVPESSVPSGD